MSTTFTLTLDGAVGTLRLEPAKPGRPPTFAHASLDAFDRALDEIEAAIARDALRVLFLRSASPRFFCAGADIAVLATLNPSSIVDWVAHGHRVFNRLARLPVPTVARVEGYALGGGLELALACDLIFAAEDAQLGQTEATLGFVAGWGGSHRLPRRVGIGRASEMFFSARILGADEAARIGLVDYSGTTGALEQHCADFARAVLTGSAQAHREHKLLLDAAATTTIEQAAAGETGASVRCLTGADTNARVNAFLQRRKPTVS